VVLLKNALTLSNTNSYGKVSGRNLAQQFDRLTTSVNKVKVLNEELKSWPNWFFQSSLIFVQKEDIKCEKRSMKIQFSV
jgi:hypothetical protein